MNEDIPSKDDPEDLLLESTSRLFQALAHVPRLRVLRALSLHGPLCAGALLERSDLNQSALSHQLRVLRDARLVSTERKGRHVYYDLADAHVAQIIEDALSHVQE